MKRILAAFVVALGIHGLLLGMKFDRLTRDNLRNLHAQPVLMTLAHRRPTAAVAAQPPPQAAVRPENKTPRTNKDVTPPRTKKAVRDSEALPRNAPRPALQPYQAPLPKISEFETADKAKAQPAAEAPVNPVAENLRPRAPSPENDASLSTRTTAVPTAPAGSPELAVRQARPLYRQNPAPPYPRLARRRGYEGSVLLEVMVLGDGTVGDVRVSVSSGHLVLDQAAVSAVHRWLFEPGRRGDQKVDTWVRVPIRFELER